MVALFHDMMHKKIEVYVDDMIAKSRTEEEHLVNLRKLFKLLRKYRLRLNPAKCTFRVARFYHESKRNRGRPRQGKGHPRNARAIHREVGLRLPGMFELHSEVHITADCHL